MKSSTLAKYWGNPQILFFASSSNQILPQQKCVNLLNWGKLTKKGISADNFQINVNKGFSNKCQQMIWIGEISIYRIWLCSSPCLHIYTHLLEKGKVSGGNGEFTCFLSSYLLTFGKHGCWTKVLEKPGPGGWVDPLPGRRLLPRPRHCPAPRARPAPAEIHVEKPDEKEQNWAEKWRRSDKWRGQERCVGNGELSILES